MCIVLKQYHQQFIIYIMNSWYHTIQNFGRRKSWQIWQITKYSPKFSCQNFSFQKQKQLLGVQLACYVNNVSKLNSMLSYYKSTANSIDQIAASQLGSTTLVKLLSYLSHIMFQPADNQQVHPQDGATKHCPSSFHSQLAILQSHTVRTYIFMQRHFCLQYKWRPLLIPQAIMPLCENRAWPHEARYIALYSKQ